MVANLNASTSVPTVIGTVLVLQGRAKAVDSLGAQRQLSVGDLIYADEVVSTEADAKLVIEFSDGSSVHLGSESVAKLDSDVFDPETISDPSDNTVSLESIQQAIAAGQDPTQIEELDPTAAGAGTSGDDGHSTVVLELTGGRTQPESGFETTGLSQTFNNIDELLFDGQLPEQDDPVLPPEEPPVEPPEVVTATITLDDVTVDESQTYTFSASVDSPPESDLTITLTNGVVITILAGELSGVSEVQAAQGDDVYLDAESGPIGIASTSGGNYEHLDTSDTATLAIDDTIDTTTVTLSTSDVPETATSVTFTATLSNPAQTDVTVSTDQGDILILANETSGELVVPFSDDDVYNDGDSISATVTGVSGGNFEDVDFSGATATATITEVVDTTTVTLNDVTVDESQNYTFSASVDHAPETDLLITLTNGVIITILAGQLSGASVVQAAQGDDVYLDAESGPIGIASTSGGNYENLDASSTATLSISDTIDPTVLTLTATEVVNPGDPITYTATLDNPLQEGQTLTVALSNGETIVISYPDLSGSIIVNQPPGAFEDITVTIDSATGHNYESLDISDDATTTVTDVPLNSALLVTNSNVLDQEVRVNLTWDSGSNTTGVVEPTEFQGQEGSDLPFLDQVEFMPGEHYTVSIEHISGSSVILTDLGISDSHGNVLNVYEGNAKLDSLDTGNNTNFDGYIFNVQIGADFAANPSDYSVSGAIGYEVDASGVLVLDTESNNSEFSLDFSELDLRDPDDIFGDVEEVNISGKGTGEDNSVTISAQDVLDLGADDGSDALLTITGDVGDVVNLVDQDGVGGGAWSETASGGGTVTYTYTNGADIATVVVDDTLTVNANVIN